MRVEEEVFIRVSVEEDYFTNAEVFRISRNSA